MRAHLIINPRARKLSRSPALLNALRASAGERCAVHLTQTLQQLDTVCAQIADDSELVLFAGGDGSLMHGVSALARHAQGPLPTIAPISVGTVDTIARNWGLYGDPNKTLQQLLAGPRRRRRQPSLRIRLRRQDDSSATADAEMIGFIFGTGLVARFFEIYNAHGAPGYAGAAKLVARIFAGSFFGGSLAKRVLTPLPCELWVEGQRQPPPAWSLICAATVDNLGLGMRLTYRAGEDPLRPHLVASSMLPHQLGPRAPLVLAGKSLGDRGGVDQLTSRFSVAFDGDGPFVLDGELMHAQHIDVSAGPPLRIALPA